MNLRRLLVLVPLMAALGACNNHNNNSTGLTRFQIVVGSTETFMVDAATGDLWKLDEGPGDEPGHWVRYADAPGDAKPLAKILNPEEEEAAEPAAEEQKDEQQPEGENQEENQENQDG